MVCAMIERIECSLEKDHGFVHSILLKNTMEFLLLFNYVYNLC